MRWKAGPTWEEQYYAKRKYLTTWQRWFAWYPVRIEGQRIWLEYAERKGTFGKGRLEDQLSREYRSTPHTGRAG